MYRSIGSWGGLGLVLVAAACGGSPRPAETAAASAGSLDGRVFLTSSAGDAMRDVGPVQAADGSAAPGARVTVHGDRPRQEFLGVGGALTQATAAALADISPGKRAEILEAYFAPDGAGYALSRTHIGSSDFSTHSYDYAGEADPTLADFTIQPDRDNGLLQLILDAQAVPGARFGMISAAWTAPAWMKDNGKLYEPEEHRGGRLLREHYDTYARYIVAYLQAYAAEGIDVWAISPVNEPGGNGGTWESMEMSPEEQRDFIRILGPRLREAGLETKVLIFDQNRAEMPEYTEVIFSDPEAEPHTWGTAVHWYNSTFKVYEDILDAEHAAHPDKPILQTEGTIDSVAGQASCDQQCSNRPCGCETVYSWWQDDAWYWQKEATDWGWDWAADREENHPKYAPAHRYARDLVVGMGHWLAGWVDWNIVLDKRGGPNHVGNFCLAPVMVDGETDTVYYTPLFYILKQVSKHSRPGGVVLETTVDGPDGFHATAIRNLDGSVAVHVFNESGAEIPYELIVADRTGAVSSPHASLQTVVFGSR